MRSDSRLLTHVDTEFELSMIKGLFEDNNITILVEKKGIGSYLAVTSGFNFQGSDVYVAENDYDKSVELLQVIQDLKPIEENEPWEEGYKEKNESKKRKYAFVAVIIPVFVFLLVIIGTIIGNFL